MTPNLLFEYIMAAGTALLCLGTIVFFMLAWAGFFDKDR